MMFPLFPMFPVLQKRDRVICFIGVRRSQAEQWEHEDNIAFRLGTVWERRLGTFLFRSSISPFQSAALAVPISFPRLRLQASGGTNLIDLCPQRLRFVDAFFKYLRYRGILLVLKPGSDDFFPGVTFVSLFLLIGSELYQIRTLQPPDLAGLEPYYRFCPKLVSVAGQRFYVDSPTR